MIKYLIFFLLFFSSCASMKKKTHNVSDIRTEMTTESQSASSSDLKYYFSHQRWDSAWHDQILHFRIYDTERYDSVTGSSPLLAEGEIKSEYGYTGIENDTSVLSVQSADTLMVSHNEKYESHEEEDSKSSISSSFSSDLVSLGIFLIGFFIVFKFAK